MGSSRSGETSGVFSWVVPIMHAVGPLSWNVIVRIPEKPIVRTGRIRRPNSVEIDPNLTNSLRFIEGRITRRPWQVRFYRSQVFDHESSRWFERRSGAGSGAQASGGH